MDRLAARAGLPATAAAAALLTPARDDSSCRSSMDERDYRGGCCGRDSLGLGQGLEIEGHWFAGASFSVRDSARDSWVVI